MAETQDVPTYFIAFCDECRQAKNFGSERERDLWKQHHPHVDPC